MPLALFIELWVMRTPVMVTGPAGRAPPPPMPIPCQPARPPSWHSDMLPIQHLHAQPPYALVLWSRQASRNVIALLTALRHPSLRRTSHRRGRTDRPCTGRRHSTPQRTPQGSAVRAFRAEQLRGPWPSPWQQAVHASAQASELREAKRPGEGSGCSLIETSIDRCVVPVQARLEPQATATSGDRSNLRRTHY
eukprot:COSAG04_NODE_9797_length_831_cov_1.132514_1_plen_193_part_00